MTRYPTPDHEGHFWAKLIHPVGEPDNEKGEWRSLNWEVVQVFDNNGDPGSDEEYGVHVPGIGTTQWIPDFVWGPEVPPFK